LAIFWMDLTFIPEPRMLNVSQGLLAFIASNLLMLMFCSIVGVFGSTISSGMGSFSGIFMHDGVEEYSILRLLERSRNWELIGGELIVADEWSPIALELLFSLFMLWSVNDKKEKINVVVYHSISQAIPRKSSQLTNLPELFLTMLQSNY